MADLAKSINENHSLWIKTGFCLKLTNAAELGVFDDAGLPELELEPPHAPNIKQAPLTVNAFNGKPIILLHENNFFMIRAL